MNFRKLLTLAVMLAFLPAIQVCQAGVSAGISFDSDGLKSFHLAIGEHYTVPEKEIIVVREQKVPDEELPVVFFLAQQANVSPRAIIKLRLGGMSWMEITFHYGLNAGIFYVPVEGNPGPPYGKAYGHFKKKKKNQWKSIHLADVDIINFVNLRFISEHYGHSPGEVIKMRSGGKNFIDINLHAKKVKADKQAKAKKHSDKDSKKSKPKGKGKKG